MRTLVIYDNTGYIYLQMGSSYRVPEGGVQFLEIEIPEGKLITGVDTTITPHTPILEEIPLSETELLKKRIEEQEAAIVELASLVGGTV